MQYLVMVQYICELSFLNVVIPLTYHKNSGYTELKVLGVYLVWCAKGIVIKTKQRPLNNERSF